MTHICTPWVPGLNNFSQKLLHEALNLNLLPWSGKSLASVNPAGPWLACSIAIPQHDINKYFWINIHIFLVPLLCSTINLFCIHFKFRMTFDVELQTIQLFWGWINLSFVAWTFCGDGKVIFSCWSSIAQWWTWSLFLPTSSRVWILQFYMHWYIITTFVLLLTDKFYCEIRLSKLLIGGLVLSKL